MACAALARRLALTVLASLIGAGSLPAEDYIRELQNAAISAKKADWGYWGPEPKNYVGWTSHSNRLIPVYTFGTLGAGQGVDLTSYTGEHSPYRSEAAIKKIYGKLPPDTLNPKADYLDQTNIFDIQRAAADAGKKYIFLVIFDGMDWQTTRNAAIQAQGAVKYDSGRGTGLHFLDYTAGGTTQFGYMCTSPFDDGTDGDVNTQSIKKLGDLFGGYSAELGGPNAWTAGSDAQYPIAKNQDGAKHAYTDSSSSASSMTAGVKIYNNSVNVDVTGAQVPTIAHLLQEQGISVGAVTSVQIPHATPGCTYAHNVSRDDYQDISRDMLGLKSISHPETPLPGLDVVIGTGYGGKRDKDNGQGKNFIPGNPILVDADRDAVDIKNGGKYVVSERTAGEAGAAKLLADAELAAKGGHRLLGIYGVPSTQHLPFATADGDYMPANGVKGKAETYTSEDLTENPKLSDMTAAAITVLSKNPKGFWLMVESGDVDWANHDDNIDNSIGAVKSGDAAVKTITDWVEQNSNWKESVLIVTADHGHYFNLTKPEVLIVPTKTADR